MLLLRCHYITSYSKAPFLRATASRCRGGPYPEFLHHFIMLSIKLRGIDYDFLRLWYELTWDWIPISQTIGKNSNQYVNGAVYWPSTRPNIPFQRRRKCIFQWDKVKSRGTVIDWWTGREWSVNCMTIISAWWRSNMPFQRLSGRLNYYITQWRQEVS